MIMFSMCQSPESTINENKYVGPRTGEKNVAARSGLGIRIFILVVGDDRYQGRWHYRILHTE